MPIRKKPFVFDGAFGTYYYQEKSTTSQPSAAQAICEFANVEDSEAVYRIHRAYIAVGVDAIKTNTYAVNANLGVSADQMKELITKGFELATLATKGTEVAVFADIGNIHTDGEEDADDAAVAQQYVDLVRIFIALGAKHFLFETLAAFAPLMPALQLIRAEVAGATVITTFAVSQDGYSNQGLFYKTLLAEAARSQLIDAVGLNCMCGPSHMVQLIQALDLSAFAPVKFCAMPNAGYPANVNGRTFYRDNITYFSNKLSNLVDLGVEVVGGCCGTTPEHIKAALQVIRGQKLGAPIDAPEISTRKKTEKRPNLFREKMFSERKVIAVELDPPTNTDVDYLISAAIQAHAAGADVITIADSPLARTRADSMMMAAKIKREVGIEVLPHLTCRDRNHIGIKSALMGARIEDVSNVLVVTGDPISSVDRGDYKGVFSMNAVNLIAYIEALNLDVFEDAPFFVGAALNVNANQMELEIERALKKVTRGAQYFLTQPVFSAQAIANFSAARTQIPAKLLAGILPIASHRNALFLNNEVSGINIPSEVIVELNGKSPEQSEAISFQFSTDIVNQLWGVCDGFYLITPLKKINLICKVIEYIRKDELRRMGT